MKKDSIKRLIYGFWEKDLGDVKERIRDLGFLTNDLVNDIVGVRRAGKTYFMFFIAKQLEKESRREQFIYLNCEHRSIYPLRLEDLNSLIEFIYEENLLKQGRVFLLLDEIQTVAGWEIFAKSVHDEFKENVKLIVSGSVKTLLSEDYGKLLSGRHKTIRMFPLSFNEYLEFEGIKTERVTEEKEAKIKKIAEDYIKYGSFPKYVLTKDLSYNEENFNDIIERDVKTRVEIRKKYVADELASLLLERNSSRISFTKVRNVLRNKGHRISTDLVIRYSSIFENVFLFFFLPVYSTKYSEIIKNPKKVYVIDNGFLGFFSLTFSENLGKLMENAVFLELLKMGLKAGKDIFYYRTDGDREVDFVVREGLKTKQLIQVCYDTEDFNTKERELKSLIKASKELKCNDLLVVTRDHEAEEEFKGKKVKFISLWKWMLEF